MDEFSWSCVVELLDDERLVGDEQAPVGRGGGLWPEDDEEEGAYGHLSGSAVFGGACVLLRSMAQSR